MARLRSSWNQWLVLVSMGFLVVTTGCAPADSKPTAMASPDQIVVSGALPTTGSLDRATLETMSVIEIDVLHDDVVLRYRGVTLESVLRRFGFTEGPSQKEVRAADRRPGWRNVVIATGADGHQAAFSAAEVCAEMGGAVVLLAWQCDGADLPPNEGPFRLIVTTDKKGARGIRSLVALDIVDMRAMRSEYGPDR